MLRPISEPTYSIPTCNNESQYCPSSHTPNVGKRLHYGSRRTVAVLTPAAASAARLNDKIENRPYADLRRWHLGFSIGVHTQGLRFAHNGFITDDGQQWRAEQVNYQPDSR